MGQFYSGSDLKKGALLRAGEPTDGTSSYDSLALKYLNQIYFNIIAGSNEFDIDCGEPWVWARSRSPIILTLKAAFGTQALGGNVGGATVSVTTGSSSGIFSTAPTTSMAGQYLYVQDNNPERYRILTHTASTTSFTLDGPYNGTTNAAANFLVLIIVYPIGSSENILRLVEPFRVYKMTFDEDRNYQIYGVDPNSFNMHYPLSSVVGGVPNRFMTFIDNDGNLSVRMNEFLTEDTRCEVDYIPVPAELTDSDTSIPLIPRAHRSLLEYGVTALLMLDKGDSRAATYVSMTQAGMKALVQATRKEQSHINSKSKGVLFPRQEYLRVRQRILAFVRQRD